MDEFKKDKKMQLAKIKYSVMSHTFLTDGLDDYPHYTAIKKL